MPTMLDDFGFALWLTLDVRGERRLQPIMQALSQRFAGPAFVPHMTLRGRIDSKVQGEALLRHVGERCAQLELSFTQLRVGEQPFEALALLPEARHMERLCALLSLSGTDPSTHVPHVSLYYGHAEPSEVLVEAQRHVHPPVTVHFTWLELWRITGEVPAWERVLRVPLATHVGGPRG